MREISSPRNDDLHKAAFEKLRQINGSVDDIFTHVYDQDVVQYWATGRAFFRPHQDCMVHKWRIVCKLLGKRQFEEIIIGGGGCNVFDRSRLKWWPVTKHADSEDGVVTVPCPLCANIKRNYGDQENLLWNNVQ